MATKTLTIDTTKKLSTSYNLKGKNTLVIKTAGGENLLDGITKVTASGSTVSIKIMGKTVKFTNVANISSFKVKAYSISDKAYYYNHTMSEFFAALTEAGKWTATLKSTTVTGSLFNENFDYSEYTKSGLTINAGAGNDIITGTKKKDTINGGAGNDIIAGGKGNDTLTGGKGKDKFVFKAGDGLDTITDATKDDIIAIDGVANKDDLKYAKNGNNLEIFYNDEFDLNNKIVVKNHFAKKGRIATTLSVGEEDINLATVEYAIAGSGKINGTSKNNVIIGSAKADTIKAGAGGDTVFGNAGADIIYGEAGSDSITGGKGNDKLYGGAGENVFYFNEGDGVDTVYSNGGEDTIQLNKFANLDDLKAGVKLSSDGTNLKIKYSDTDTVVLNKYYTNKTNSVQHIADKNGNTTSIEDLISSSPEINVSGSSGKFTGTAGNDKFVSTTANETFTGKTGNDRIVFSGKFGKDVVNLTKNENLILDMSGYEDLFGGHVRRTVNGNNLVIKAYNENNKLYGQITLKNFAKSDVTGANGSVILRLPDEDIDLNQGDFDVHVTESYTGSRFNEYIDAWNANKAISITGGKGDDYITSSSHKATTFIFNKGDGHDILSNTKKGDVIQINNAEEISYEKNGDDLVIYYSEGDAIQVDGYFSAEDSRIDTIKIKNANGKYDTKSLAKETNLEEIQRTVLNVRINDGEIVLPADTQYETINFVGYNGFTSISTYGPEYGWEGKNDDDLYMPYGNYGDMIIFKDFFKNNGAHNTKYISVAGETFDLPRRFYSGNNDNIVAPKTEDWLYLDGGNHKITFTENNHYHNYDYIYSEGAQYTDTLVLNDYSFRNGEIEIGRETSSNGSLVIYANDGKADGRRNNILYRHYFDGETPLVNIVDKNGTITMDRTFETATLDWTTNAEKNKDHVLFVNNNSETEATTTTVISNTKANQIFVDAYTKEDATAKLNYTYNGGNDVIDTGDYYANDTYNIATFTAASRLSVLDNGGYSDTVNVNANSDDFYLLFDVDNYISVEPNPDDWAIGLVHKDAMAVDTLRKYFTTYNNTDATVAGVLKFNGAGWGNAEESDEWDTEDYGGTIEYIRTNDNNDRLDIAAWKKYVAGRVANWLENNSSVEGKNLKFYYGSPVRVMEAVADGRITLTEAQYESLLGCYKVKYSELPQNGAFESTTGNDIFNLEEANNTITFNNSAIGNDTINSTKEEYNASYKDRIIFTEETGYSVKDGTLNVGVDGNDLVMSADENNLVTYTNFVNDTAHNDVILTDASNDKYNLSVVTTGSNFQEGSNNIAFVYNDNVANSVAGTTGTNFIYSYGENEYYYDETNKDNLGMWNCVYRGGTDTVVSFSDKASDKYEIYAFDTKSKLNVTDFGGNNDSLYIAYTSPKYNVEDPIINNVRFVFDVDSNGAVYDDFMLVHKDVLNSATLANTLENDLVAGVLKYNATPTAENSFGIESFKYFKDYNKDPETGLYPNVSVDVDINTWKDTITENVAGWLSDNGAYTSAYDAIENCNDAAKLAELVQCYNVDYTTLG